MDRRLTITIVDDDEEVARLMGKVLTAAGHKVEILSSSVGAITRLLIAPPDLLLVDIMMPEVDGLELTKKLREIEGLAAMRIIVVSGKAYEFDQKRARLLGADGFIQKPVQAATLAAQVERIVEDKMNLTYWGVRGTLPAPGPQSVRYGGNTSCVTIEYSDARLLIFDAGTGIRMLGNHLLSRGRPRLDAKILISHPHWDHINAFPFFKPLYIPGNEFEVMGPIHGDKSMHELVAAQMDDVFFPITLKELGARMLFRDLRQQTFTVFRDIEIKTLLLSHPGYCLGYRVFYKGRSISYITDNELYLPDHPSYNQKYLNDLVQFVSGTDVLITDCTYTDAEYKTRVGWGHSCVTRVAEFAAAAKVKSLHLFHHDPDQDDDAIDRKFADVSSALKALGSEVVCLAPSEGSGFQI